MAPQSKPNQRQLPQYKPTLRTDSEYEIPTLAFFAIHRIATTECVQNAFPQRFRYNSTVIPHLHWLANKGYLRRRNYDRGGYLWTITEPGYIRCRDKAFRSQIPLNVVPYSYEEPTGTQAEHDLLITRAAVSIYNHVSISETMLLQDGRYMLRDYSWAESEEDENVAPVYPFEHIYPDYWYISRDDNGLMIRFVEVVAGENSPARIRAKVREYLHWGSQPDIQRFLNSHYRKYGAQSPVPEYQVHLILESRNWKYTDEWKERMTWMQVIQEEPEIINRVWTTTKERLDEALAAGGSINDAEWKRAKDVLSIKEQWEIARPKIRARLLDEHIQNVPTYPLFA